MTRLLDLLRARDPVLRLRKCATDYRSAEQREAYDRAVLAQYEREQARAWSAIKALRRAERKGPSNVRYLGARR